MSPHLRIALLVNPFTLHTKAGESAKLEVLRDGKRLQMPIQTSILSFRK